FPDMRGGILDLTDNCDVLTDPGNRQSVARTKLYVILGAARRIDRTTDVDDQTANRLSGPQLGEQVLPDTQRLGRILALLSLCTLQGDGSQIRLHALGQCIELLPFLILDLLAREYSPLREGEGSEPARALYDRAQSFAFADGVATWEAHLALESDGALRRPVWNLLDDQRVVRLQLQIRLGVPTQNGREIHRDHFGATRSVLHVDTGELGVQIVRAGIEPATGANEVADSHMQFQRVLTGGDGMPVDRHDRRGRLVASLG